MKTTVSSGTPHNGVAPHKRASDLCGAAQLTPMSTTPLRLQQAIAQAEFLGQELTSKHQELIAAREQVERLIKANAQLKQFAAQREHELAKLCISSHCDELAGLPKPTPLLDRVNHSLAGAKQQSKQVALLLLDLEGFEPVTDPSGGATGDRLLQRVAEQLPKCVRGGDSACRCGDGELVPPVPEVDNTLRALDVVPKLRDRQARPHAPGSPARAATAGIGIALPEVDDTTPQCSAWKLTDFFLSAGLDPKATPHIELLLTRRNRIRKGGVIYRVGDGFDALYAIRTGSCKTVLLAKDGQDQVAGFHMAGEIIGIDGIGTETHECQAIALEDMEICPMPFDQIENLARRSEQFGHTLHKLLSQEGARARSLMIVLGTMRAEQRLAMFLLDLSERYRARGYSSCEFVLRLTREEIGSYLGLKLETVSRLFSRFQREGLIHVEGRAVRLLDQVAVSHLINCST